MRCATATAIACLGVLVLAPPALAAPPKPLGLDCKDQNGVRFCQGDGSAQRVASWDGVPLDADVTLPPASQGDGPFPAIAMLHGYGGSKADFETDTIDGGKKQADGSVKTDTRFHHWNNVWFAQRGYVVLNYTARGFGKSCGSQDSRTPDCFQNVQNQDPSSAGWLHLKDRRREAHDTQFLLGKLVDEGLVKPKELAATGISYGGGESIELAYLKDRIQKVSDSPTDFEPWVSPEKKIPMTLAAAYPRWPWSDLVSALTPNGRFLDFDASTADKSRFPPGIPIQSYIAGLYAL
ncbi:MAG: type transport system ATP-binding protein, partial [Thermoleophilaceae bacterium]|nr:type transport system ATP-binding protein [Thermoleophilaceae bacterium]